MRVGWIVLAVAALLAIGSAEAFESVRQLADLPDRGQRMLTPTGAPLTVISFALSAAVYVTLGVLLARSASSERLAVVSGVMTGVAAGLIGGTLRALAASGYVGRIVVGSYGLPVEFLIAVLVTFVVLSTVASAAGGAAITWLGFRGGRRRPMRRPPR